MTKQEMTREQAILHMIRAAEKYGFETFFYPTDDVIPSIKQTDESYANFTIRSEYENMDHEKRQATRRVTVTAQVCRMNTNADAAELIRASQEIMNAALLVMELEKLDLCWTEQY